MKEDFVLAKVCESRLEADMLKAFLDSEGIEAMIIADDAGGMIPTLSSLNGVFLYVPREDFERAKEVIDSYKH